MNLALTAEQVRDARKQLGLTQAGLSRALGLNPDAVRDWERGRNPCKGPAVLAISFLLQGVQRQEA